MRRIEKGPPPPCLARLMGEARRVERATGKPARTDDWDPGACAQPIRDALYRDQGGLCGYCLQRIDPKGHLDLPPPTGNGGMRIEHVIARQAQPGRMYDWANLLGVCGGRSGAPGGAVHDHCDRARGSQELRLNPIGSPQVETALRFSRNPPPGLEGGGDDGVWIVASPELQNDIEVLNLNNPTLRRRRRDIEVQIAGRLADLQRRGRSELAYLKALLATATTPGPGDTLPAFAPVVRQYAQRKLDARRGGDAPSKARQ